MKLLYCHRTRAKGADGTHIKGIISGFQKAGFAVDVLSPYGFDAGASFAYAKKNEPPGKVQKPAAALLSLPRLIFELLELLYNIPLMLKLLVLRFKKEYDMVYERYAFLNLGGYFFSCICRIPLLLEVNFTTETVVYPKRTGVFRRLEKAIEKIVFRQAAVIIVISKRLKEDIAAFGIDAEKILVVPNAVEIGKFNPASNPAAVRARHGIKETDRVVGFVGSFYPWHGIDFLLDSFFAVLDSCANAKLMLLGQGQMFEHLKNRVKKEGLEKKVLFTGRVAHNALPEYIAAFDVGIMPDSNNYGSPMKIFEYMAMKKPVVAPELEPIKAVITHGREGLLFPQRDKKALEERLISLLNNPELCASLGDEGRKKVLAEHTWQKNVERIIRLYEELYKKG